MTTTAVTPIHEYTFIDKSAWGDGEWGSEPDKVQWRDEATGLPCLAVRHPSLGHFCGYVGVSEGHPLFGIGHSECSRIPKCEEEWCDHTPESVLGVHGGVTFSGYCQEGEQETGICHVPEEGQLDRVFWFGFDLGHAGDLVPGTRSLLRSLGSTPFSWEETYRTLAYVQEQVAQLARQLHELASVPAEAGV